MEFSRQFVAEMSLVGMGLDLVGGLYLAYDLLGGKRGPLRALGRALSYSVLFFAGYFVVLGLRYAAAAATGMGILLAAELRRAGIMTEAQRRRGVGVLVFAFLRGLVLGIAAMTIAPVKFGVAFGVLSGLGLVLVYWLGYSPTDDYETGARPHTSKHKMLASLWRGLAIGAAGVASDLVASPGTEWVLFGLRLGLAAGMVSAIVSLFSPSIEWWIEHVPERRLGVMGVCLIFGGMVLQSIQYWVVVRGLNVR